MPPTRRDILQLAGQVAALPGTASVLAPWLFGADDHQHASGGSAPPDPLFLASYHPKFFDSADFEALQAFTEILIPSDDTPGAREARCAYYIDFFLQSASDHGLELPQAWRKAMEVLKATGFHEAGPERRLALVEEISKPERDRNAKHPAYETYRLVKQFNTFAFYTSRAGLIDSLDYRGNSYNSAFPACDHPEH